MRRPSRFRHLAAAAAVATLAIGARARADVVPSKKSSAPPCTAPGQPCLTDELEGKDGTCVAATCTRQVRMRDGSTTPVGVPCFECKAGAKGSTPPPKSKSSGCSVAVAERGDTGPRAVTVALIAGLLLMAARRRKVGPSP